MGSLSNTSFIGFVGNTPHILTVDAEGKYIVNKKEYSSLSSAAESVGAPVRKSGWVFWKLADGRTIKEAYGNLR